MHWICSGNDAGTVPNHFIHLILLGEKINILWILKQFFLGKQDEFFIFCLIFFFSLGRVSFSLYPATSQFIVGVAGFQPATAAIAVVCCLSVFISSSSFYNVLLVFYQFLMFFLQDVQTFFTERQGKITDVTQVDRTMYIQ